jgi:hypothetical protein
VNGGTGVANSFTLTVSGANRTLDQDVSTIGSPAFVNATFSGRPRYVALATSAASNATGDATTYYMLNCFAGTVLNQGFTVNEGTGTLTVPATTIYEIGGAVKSEFLGAAHTVATFDLEIFTGGLTVYPSLHKSNPANMRDANNEICVSGRTFLSLNSGDTVRFRVTVSGGTKVVRIAATRSTMVYMRQIF